MKIKSVRIENFRGFRDETIHLNRYACFVGPNGAGKSTVLAALNVFFQDRTSTVFDTAKLSDEDYFGGDTSRPIRITLTFDDLSDAAREALSNYTRNDELVVMVEAQFDPEAREGRVRHIGERSGLEAFRVYFGAVKSKSGAKDVYERLRSQYPDLPKATSHDARSAALEEYELAHPDDCILIPSEDTFYGINSTGKLAEFVQWVYVPAVKEASDEGLEAKNTVLGKLISRAVQNRSNLDDELGKLQHDTQAAYAELLDRNNACLKEIEGSLNERLASWAHPDARLQMGWQSDPVKSVVVQAPMAGIKTGDGDFVGSLARMGHGLQRSYLLALLQELADADAEGAPTLILGCEEPELYQHPPQARHLADTFARLTSGNNQILVTTHSPLFVSGNGFENTRLVRRGRGAGGETKVKGLTYPQLCARIRTALCEDTSLAIDGRVAKIHQALQPGVSEMFFARVPVLVEGLEDVAYITTQLYLDELWEDFRRLGCHLIPVNGKSKLIQPLAIAAELDLPVFVVFDADGDNTNESHRRSHEQDNKAILSLLEAECDAFPDACVIGHNHAIWPHNLGATVQEDFGNHYSKCVESARLRYAQESGLTKNELFIADWLTKGREDGHASPTLGRLCEAILEFGRSA